MKSLTDEIDEAIRELAWKNHLHTFISLHSFIRFSYLHWKNVEIQISVESQFQILVLILLFIILYQFSKKINKCLKFVCFIFCFSYSFSLFA